MSDNDNTIQNYDEVTIKMNGFEYNRLLFILNEYENDVRQKELHDDPKNSSFERLRSSMALKDYSDEELREYREDWIRQIAGLRSLQRDHVHVAKRAITGTHLEVIKTEEPKGPF
jgi:hypothetical protein